MKLTGTRAIRVIAGVWVAGWGMRVSAATADTNGAAMLAAQSAVGQTAQTAMKARGWLREGQHWLNNGNWPAAEDAYQKVLAVDPSNEAACFGLSAAWLQAGRYEESMGILEELRQRAPDSPVLLNNMAWIHAKAREPKLRDPEKAVRYAREALLALPGDPNILNTLAEAYYASGDYAKAYRVAVLSLEQSRRAGMLNLDELEALVERCAKAAGKPVPQAALPVLEAPDSGAPLSVPADPGAAP